MRSRRSQFLMTRTLPFIGSALILYFLFLIYKLEAYQWLCENESNHAACYMVGTLKMERGNRYQAKRFFERSCELDYGLGCFELAEMADSDGRADEGLKYYKKACRFKYEPACRVLQKAPESSRMDSL